MSKLIICAAERSGETFSCSVIKRTNARTNRFVSIKAMRRRRFSDWKDCMESRPSRLSSCRINKCDDLLWWRTSGGGERSSSRLAASSPWRFTEQEQSSHPKHPQHAQAMKKPNMFLENLHPFREGATFAGFLCGEWSWGDKQQDLLSGCAAVYRLFPSTFWPRKHSRVTGRNEFSSFVFFFVFSFITFFGNLCSCDSADSRSLAFAHKHVFSGFFIKWNFFFFGVFPALRL